MRILTRLFVALGLLGCIASSASAQGMGVVAGRVLDTTGGPVPGAFIRLDPPDRRRSFEAVTDANGNYRIEVPAGRYDALFAAGDFATTHRSAIDVQPGATVAVTAVLQVSVSAHVTVTAERIVRDAASAGHVTPAEIHARPIMRAGDLVEAVPGLVASQHSGEGKANQFYLRGFNLDHGTDFAATVAGVPVNLPTHAHGQGYADLNFVIPELVASLEFRKGPYYADHGDFSSAGAVQIEYAHAIEAPLIDVSVGGDGWGRVLAAASPGVAGGQLLAAVELSRNDGPWESGDGYRKRNGLLRYTRGDARSGWSITGASYAAQWRSTDQVPQRAVDDGAIGRFAAVDRSNGGETWRHSLAFDAHLASAASETRATAYVFSYGLNLFSNFTYFLDDPLHGDQFEQVDRRIVSGFDVSHVRRASWMGRTVEHRTGFQVRHDRIRTVGLHATQARARHATVREDRVAQTAAGAWADMRVQWTTWLRTTAGLRADGHRFAVDASRADNGGREAAALLSPKLNVVFGPWRRSELYVNAGDGFHSNDARGTTIAVDPRTGDPVDRATPLVRTRGAEAGFRTSLLPRTQVSLALWRLTAGSELLFAGDAGTTIPGRPSARFGVELSADAAVTRWLNVDADLAWSRARFSDDDAAGRAIPGSVPRVVSVGVSAGTDRMVFGAVRVRSIGSRPLVEDGSVRSRPATVVNATAGVRLSQQLALVVSAFNLFDRRASDVDYFYVSRLPGEPAEGVTGVHTHPAVPRTLRVALRFSR